VATSIVIAFAADSRPYTRTRTSFAMSVVVSSASVVETDFCVVPVVQSAGAPGL
jgi:hypothetical protein